MTKEANAIPVNFSHDIVQQVQPFHDDSIKKYGMKMNYPLPFLQGLLVCWSSFRYLSCLFFFFFFSNKLWPNGISMVHKISLFYKNIIFGVYFIGINRVIKKHRSRTTV